MSFLTTAMNLMTTKEAALHFGVSQKTIQRWIKQGKLKADRIDGRWFVHHETHPVPNEGHDVPKKEQREPHEGHFRELLSRADSFIAHLREQLACRDEQIDAHQKQIDNLTQQIDHLTQLLAVQTKTNATLTEQLSAKKEMIEDLRRRPWWKRIFSRS